MPNESQSLVVLSLVASLLGSPASALPRAQSPRAVAHDDGPAVERRVVAGGTDDFMQVTHLSIEGSSFEIGRALAGIARERHGYTLTPSADPRRTRAQRRYFETHHTAHLERMRGVASLFGQPVDEDAYVFSSLSFGFAKPGCSVVFFPPDSTVDGVGGVLSRNFDFTTGTFRGRLPGEDEIPICSTPYVLELVPDDGYSSLSVCAYDLLGGVVDGMNSEGLTVALLADDEVAREYGLEGSRDVQAGFDVVQVGRYLLDTCANVDEAIDALLGAKLYYGSIPCHYIVADRHGRSFVWENAPSLTHGYIIDGDGAPQATTNFLHHRHPDPDALPEEASPSGSFNRYRALRERFPREGERLSVDEIRAANDCVAAVQPAPNAPWAPGRTLWHVLYFPEERRMEVDFYLGEDAAGVRRSEVLDFALKPRPKAGSPR